MLSRTKLIKNLWCAFQCGLPDRSSTCDILVWKRCTHWTNIRGISGWAFHFDYPSKLITYRKSCAKEPCSYYTKILNDMTHWMYLPLPEVTYDYYIEVSMKTIRNKLWVEVDKRLPEITKTGGYILYNTYTKFLTIATGTSARNIIKYSTVTGKNRIKYWMPLEAPDDIL